MTTSSKVEEKGGSQEEPLSPAASVREAFFALLNNKGKRKGRGARSGGFLCLVRAEESGALSLKGMQALCHDARQSWNQCRSLRYRIEGAAGFGTLAYALVHDLWLPLAGDGDALGAYGVAGGETGGDDWQGLVERLRKVDAADRFPAPLENGVGVIDEAWFEALSEVFGQDAVLATGERLVIFGEFDGSGDPAEWSAVLSRLQAALPERVGFVFSGLPEGLTFEPDGLHAIELQVAPGDGLPGPDEGPPAAEAQTFDIAGLNSDRPAAVDSLNVTRYAQSLASFILHPDTTPLTIGVHGPWGKGKSSFMGFIESHLNREAAQRRAPERVEALDKSDARRKTAYDALAEAELTDSVSEELRQACRTADAAHDQAKDDLEATAEAEVISVRFNAWRFQDAAQIWAGLASVVLDRLEGSLTRWQKLRLRFFYLWRARRTEFWRSAIEIGLAALLAAVFLLWMSLGEGIAKASQDDSLFAVVALYIGGPLAVFLLVAWRLHGAIRPVGQRVLEYAQLPDYRAQRGFQHKVLEDLQTVSQAHSRLTKSQPRIVIFIDDLDRCSDEKIMEILQAINLVLAESHFFVVMGVDTAMLYRAIEAHYAELQKGKGRPEDFARRYLRKIIQLSFHLPDSDPVQRQAYIAGLFSPAARNRAPALERPSPTAESDEPGALPPLAVDPTALVPPDPAPLELVRDTPVELQAFTDFAAFIEDNARETKRLINVHRLVKILLQEPNEGWSAERQRQLVRWLIFCSGWPWLIDEAQAYAAGNPDDGDIFAAEEIAVDTPWRVVLEQTRGLAAFAAASHDTPIPASALTGDRALLMAAKIAALVRDDEAAPTPEETPSP
ncbi:MAG: hypothetical protein Kilf2KO_31210 [Rhodospirillales bacterium]